MWATNERQGKAGVNIIKIELLASISSSDINTLAPPLFIFPALHFVINDDIECRNCCEQSKDTPENNQESAHNYLPSAVSVGATVVFSTVGLVDFFSSSF